MSVINIKVFLISLHFPGFVGIKVLHLNGTSHVSAAAFILLPVGEAVFLDDELPAELCRHWVQILPPAGMCVHLRRAPVSTRSVCSVSLFECWMVRCRFERETLS